MYVILRYVFDIKCKLSVLEMCKPIELHYIVYIYISSPFMSICWTVKGKQAHVNIL